MDKVTKSFEDGKQNIGFPVSVFITIQFKITNTKSLIKSHSQSIIILTVIYLLLIKFSRPYLNFFLIKKIIVKLMNNSVLS